MAYVDLWIGDVGSKKCANESLYTHYGLPSIPSNASLDSVVLTFNIYRQNGGTTTGAEVRIKCGDSESQIYNKSIPRDETTYCSFDFTPYVVNNNGYVTFTDGSQKWLIHAWHNLGLVTIATWTTTSVNIRANYTIPTYTVTWKNYDGTVLETDTGVEKGTVPTYNGATPTKPEDKEYTYTFSGWKPSVGAVTGNVTYEAQFSSTKRQYTVTLATSPLSGGVTTKEPNQSSYEYGTSVTITAVAGDIYKFVSWNDGVTDVTRTITVLGDTTYTAYFKLNAVFVDTSQSTKVYVDTAEANEIYVDEIKVYE